MGDERDEIRARIDLVDLVGREVPLRKRGRSWTGLCPFHDDRNPSFTVSQETGRYRCWSCGEHGDCFTWVMKRQNVDFVEALKILAHETGIELKARGPVVPPSVREAQDSAMRAALDFFRGAIARSPAVREYIVERAIDPATLEKWEIGYAPSGGDELAVHLKRTGHSLALGKELFLVDGDDRDGYRDKFRGRLIFPIRDERGHLVAFGGRIVGAGQPKYINSSDTPLYRKSRVLYGLDRGRDVLAKERHAVLCEGYIDVIACHRAGVVGAVASLGTALSQEHAKLLKRWADRVTVLYDSDDAGRKAADRAVDVLSAEGVPAKIALMPQGDDPDTLLRTRGSDAVRAAVEGAISPYEYRLALLERDHPPATEEFWPLALDLLAQAPSEIELTRHVDRLAPHLPGVRDPRKAERAIRSEVTKRRRGGRRTEDGPAPARRIRLEPLNSAEAIVFRAFLEEETRREGWMAARSEPLFATELGVRLSRAIAAAFPVPPEGAPRGWMHRVGDDELAERLGNLLDDPRASRVSSEVLRDAMDGLRTAVAKRQSEQALLAAEDPEEKQRILLRLRQRKPDTKIVQNDEDDGLF